MDELYQKCQYCHGVKDDKWKCIRCDDVGFVLLPLTFKNYLDLIEQTKILQVKIDILKIDLSGKYSEIVKECEKVIQP